MASVNYPDAHLLGIPVELRELIYDFLISEPNKLWHKNTPLQVSASNTPPLSLLLAHRTFQTELLPHFYRRTVLTLHITAYAAVKSYHGDTTFRDALTAYPHIKTVRTIEIRPRLNAGVEFLKYDMEPAIDILLAEAKELRTVIVGWSEVPLFLMGGWRPWPYKGIALDPLKKLIGKVRIEVGEAIVPPRKTAEKEQEGLKRAVRKIIEGSNAS